MELLLNVPCGLLQGSVGWPDLGLRRSSSTIFLLPRKAGAALITDMPHPPTILGHSAVHGDQNLFPRSGLLSSVPDFPTLEGVFQTNQTCSHHRSSPCP
jgi:hypothetical protein